MVSACAKPEPGRWPKKARTFAKSLLTTTRIQRTRASPRSLRGTARGPFECCDRVPADSDTGSLQPKFDLDDPGGSRIRQNQNAHPIWILEAGMMKLSHALRIEPACASPDEAGIVGEGPELSAMGNFFALRVDGYHAAAIKRTDVGPPLFI